MDGIGHYTSQLMKRLSLDGRLDVVPYAHGCSIPGDILGLRNGPIILPNFIASLALSSMTGLPFPGTRKLTDQVDLIHATDHFIPNLGKIPMVASLMDSIPLAHPEWVAPRLRKLKNLMWKRSAKWADHFVTISRFSKEQIETHFGIPEERIHVIPLGVDEHWFDTASESITKKTLSTYSLPDRYFIFVGALQPRKNIQRIIKAHSSLPAHLRHEIPLIIAGHAGWQCDDLVQAFAAGRYGKSVMWLKYVPDNDLSILVKNAIALVFPSLYEGFGLPVLEAFAANTPVITSTISALPEVAGDAALLVDPLDEGQIADAMQRISEDIALAHRLRHAGQARARLFSWDDTANLHIGMYQKILGIGQN